MTPYRRGQIVELKLAKNLKASKEYHTVVRSAGSRGPFDLVAIGEHQILLCQVKSGPGYFRSEVEKLGRLPVPRCARVELWVHHRGQWTVTPITD